MLSMTLILIGMAKAMQGACFDREHCERRTGQSPADSKHESQRGRFARFLISEVLALSLREM